MQITVHKPKHTLTGLFPIDMQMSRAVSQVKNRKFMRTIYMSDMATE